jgi:serine protease Do
LPQRVVAGSGGWRRWLAGLLLVAILTACLSSAPDPNDVVIAAMTPVPRTVTPTATPAPPTATPAPTATAPPAVPTPTPASTRTLVPNLELAAEIAPVVVRVPTSRRMLDQATGVVSLGSSTESGFLISPDGYVLTTYHGVGGATEIEVEIPGHGVQSALLVGASQCSDLALLKIADGDYPHLRLSQIKVALHDTIYVAGIEAGSKGFVFVPGRVKGTLVQYANEWAMPHNVIRHDIDVGAGAIGEPVVDERGRVVGISYANATLGSDGFAVGSRHINKVRAGLRGGKNVT